MAKREKTSRYEYQKSYQKKYWIGLPKSIRASKRYYQLYIQTKDFTAHDFKILINQKRHSCKEYKKVRDFEEIKRLRTEIKILCGLKEICIIKEQEEHIAGQNVDTPEKRDERKNSPLMDGETGLPWNGWDGKTFINPKRFYFKPLKEPLLCLFESDFKKIVFKSTLGKASPLRNPFTLFDSYRGNKKFARNYKRQERIDYLKWLVLLCVLVCIFPQKTRMSSAFQFKTLYIDKLLTYKHRNTHDMYHESNVFYHRFHNRCLVHP